MELKTFFQRVVVSLFLVASLTARLRADVDTDGDGVTDSEEIAAGTNPNNSQSVPWRVLGSWRFSDSTFTGDNGQQPIAQSNVSITSSGFAGPGVNFPSGSGVSLKYRAVEASGTPNISAVRGSVLFRIKPSWITGTGPGSTVTVLQTTNWAVKINPVGSVIMLTSTSGATTITNAQASIDVGTFGSFWSYGLVTYSPEGTTLEFDAPSTRVAGPGISAPSNFNASDKFFAIGSAADGSGSVKALMDEIVAFDAPGALGLTPVAISAGASNSPTGINLFWPSATNALTEVKRRVVGSTTWEVTRAAFGTNFFDKTAVPGQRYEYNLNTRIADVNTGLPEDVGQFIKASLNGSPIHSAGKIILLVDQTLTNGIQNELSGFITNLVGDGWQVLRLDVPRHVDDFSLTPSFAANYFTMTNLIKPFVNSNYALFGSEIKYILAIGHVPIPYTGTKADDGHTDPSDLQGAHTGAWACDLFYGDVDGNWTDSLSVTTSRFVFNRNSPNDGRQDQDLIPSNSSGTASLEIPVARVDLSFLPAFSDSETELLKKYFQKDANYRNAIHPFAADAMAVEDLPAGGTGVYELGTEMISRLSPLKQVISGDPFVDTRSLVIGIESGPGAFDRINDAQATQHTTADVASGTLTTNCAFYFLRGSYFPDWNVQFRDNSPSPPTTMANNFLRAPLGMANGGLTAAAFIGLTKAWRVTGLGVGDSIGSDMLEIVNTWSTPGNVQSVRSIELMGDPTLRYPVLAPPSGLSWKVTNSAVYLSWSGAAGASGYFIYRSTNGISGPFQVVNTSPVSSTTYTDTTAPSGTVMYMVRGSALSTTGSGTFTNLSQGIFSRPISSADPSNCCVPPVNINEDNATGILPFSIGEAGSEHGLNVSATSSLQSLVPDGSIAVNGSGANRTVAITPLGNQFGVTTITITAQTDFSTVVREFLLTVAPVNDAPLFTKGANVTIAQGTSPQTFNGWATSILAGPTNESTQVLTFVVTNNNVFLFSTPPAISSTGTLTFTPSAQRGSATVTVRLKDDGGTANGGVDTTAAQTFTITVGLPQDTDGDGLPDDFEQLYGFNPNSPGDQTGDWDGDGATNLQEFAAGTNPKDSRSALRISSASSQSPSFAVQFNSVGGNTYSFEGNDTFPSGSWQLLAGGIAGTGSSIQQVDNTAGGSNRRIYRVTTGTGSLVTEYAGFARLSLGGNSDTYVSIPFLRPAAELAAVLSVGGNNVQVRGPGAWTTSQWVYSGGQSNTYFMLIRSGALEGEHYTITANTSDTLTLDLEGDSLAGLQAGDSIAVVPYWTVGTLFHGGAGANASTSPAVRQTELLLPTVNSNGTNFSAAGTYYFFNGAWRQVGQGNVIKNDDVILPDMYIIVRQNVATATTLTTEGEVLAGKIRATLRRNTLSLQDNLLALPRPVTVSLSGSGLVDLNDPFNGPFRASSASNQRTDELFMFDNAAIAKNKSALADYYFFNGAWRKIGSGSGVDVSADAVFPPGAGVVIRSGTGSSSAVWVNTASY